MVFDEAHQAVAATYQRLVETLVTRNSRTGLLGLSATPGRTGTMSMRMSLLPNCSMATRSTLEFDGINPIERLTKEGYLAAANFTRLDVASDLDLSAADRTH